MRFAQFYAAAPVCSPSRAGLLTGRQPIRAGMPNNAPSEEGKPGMPGREVTSAEMLRSAGYATGHVGKWHLGYSPETMPIAQGFDSSFGHMGGCIDNYSHFFFWGGPNRHDLHRNGREVHAPGRFFGDLMVEEGIAFLRRNQDRPFFLYFAINEPHYPYQGDPKWLDRYAGLKYPRNLYAAFLSTMDERIGRLLDEVDAASSPPRTDDRDRPVGSRAPRPRERPLRRRRRWGPYCMGPSSACSKGASACPAIVSGPGHLPRERGPRPRSATAATGCPRSPNCAASRCRRSRLDGKSLAGVIRSADAPSPHDALHWQFDKSWAVRSGDWKLLHDVLDHDPPPRARRADRRGDFLVNLRRRPVGDEQRAAAASRYRRRCSALHAEFSLEP